MICKKMKTRSVVGLVLATLHGALVVYVVKLIVSGIEPDWPMYWMIFIHIDFPFSLLAMVIGGLLEWISPDKLLWFSPDTSPLNDVVNFWIPLFVFGVLGTLWWAILPSLLTSAYKKLKRKISKTRTPDQ
jgi:hypothetical protein